MRLDAIEDEFKSTLERIEYIFDSEPNTPEGDELERLVSFVESLRRTALPHQMIANPTKNWHALGHKRFSNLAKY